MLPQPTTPLIGREAEVERLLEHVSRARLITITGPGGIGKTRLALAAAQRLEQCASDWAPGAVLVDLVGVDSVSGLCGCVARALDADAPPGDDPVAMIGALLARRGPKVVVLDNFEPIVDVAAPVVRRWLELAPAARFVVTSRQRLRLAAEVAMALGPLAPAAAEQLLVERAEREPAFSLTEGDRPAIAALARGLDGIPLALELAAGQLGVLTAAELVARLDASLDLLVGGPRDAAPRHATLRAAIDGSWATLSEPERATLARCSVLEGGMTLESTRAVVGELPGAPPLDPIVRSLVDRSLITVVGTADGARRFRLFASIRAYAAEKLAESADREAARARHAEHFAQQGERVVHELGSRHGARASQWVAREDANLKAAWRWARDAARSGARPVTDALRIVGVLSAALATSGPFDELQALLDEALALARALEAPAEALAELLQRRAWNGLVRGQFSACERDLDDADALLGDRAAPQRVALLSTRATLRRRRGEHAGARAGYEHALETARQDEDAVAVGYALANLGGLALEGGDRERAAALFREGAAVHRDCRHLRGEAVTVGNLGLVLQEMGAMAEALASCERALSLHRETGDRRFEGIARADIGGLLAEHGAFVSARPHYAAAVALLDATGDLRHRGLVRAALAACDAALGELEAAERGFVEALDALTALDDRLLEQTARVYHATLSAAWWAGALVRGDEASARHFEADARAALADDGVDAAHDSDERRLARRLLGGRVEAVASLRSALVIGAGGGWFRPPKCEVVSLESRATLGRLLDHLARARLTAPAERAASDVRALFEAGWPGEQISGESATNRVHVTLSTLRKQGLREHIERDAAGWALSDDVPLVRLAADAWRNVDAG